jgi:hypothetical protein
MKQVTKVSPKTHPFTHEIEFLAVGVSEKRGKFLLVTKGDQHEVLSVRNLGRDPSAELERLEALDVHFLVPKARNDFLHLAQEAARMKPTFKVATQIGWFGDVFVTPSGVYPKQAPVKGMPKGWARIQGIWPPRTRMYTPASAVTGRPLHRTRYSGSAKAIPV